MKLNATIIGELLVSSIIALSKIIERKDGYFAEFKLIP